ncbi:DUF2071 domain-containing protein [Candidatus Uabimicrobium sp. HlEnr_7]|uniref:DUF2071 domain-containing protein n=1 Tax=Candidatus Uabimicrobium helgolandensis TaxID=3095367 RepID=UPI003556A835
MKVPAIRGLMDRRILANYRVDPQVMAKVLPAPFRPKVINDYAIGGICLIRLKKIRPAFLPFPFGGTSENAAHRIAVEWDTDGKTHEGVYVPRRDTDSYLNAVIGSKVFPTLLHYAAFETKEENDNYYVAMKSKDNTAFVEVEGHLISELPKTSVFKNLQEASVFFEAGAVGYSDTRQKGKYDGIELQCKNWKVEALQIENVRSSFFDDIAKFPKGTVEFDCALLMRDIDHKWHSRSAICC